jgi:hypothetical protein
MLQHDRMVTIERRSLPQSTRQLRHRLTQLALELAAFIDRNFREIPSESRRLMEDAPARLGNQDRTGKCVEQPKLPLIQGHHGAPWVC